MKTGNFFVCVSWETFFVFSPVNSFMPTHLFLFIGGTWVISVVLDDDNVSPAEDGYGLHDLCIFR